MRNLTPEHWVCVTTPTPTDTLNQHGRLPSALRLTWLLTGIRCIVSQAPFNQKCHYLNEEVQELIAKYWLAFYDCLPSLIFSVYCFPVLTLNSSFCFLESAYPPTVCTVFLIDWQLPGFWLWLFCLTFCVPVCGLKKKNLACCKRILQRLPSLSAWGNFWSM